MCANTRRRKNDRNAYHGKCSWFHKLRKFGYVGSVLPQKPVCLTHHRTFNDGTVPNHIGFHAEDVVKLPSMASCIKSPSKNVFSADHQPLSNLPRGVLVSSLGSGGLGGSLYFLDLSRPLELNFSSPSLQRRLFKVASTSCTIWYTDINYDGTRAVIGTSNGVSLVHIERQKLSPICQSKSDVLSLQFDHTGNIVLCGLRNGALISLDVRQRHFNILENFSSSSSSRHRKFSNHGFCASKHRKALLKGAGISGGLFMPSAVCSLSILHSYGNCFLASSMDGSVCLFDSRLLNGDPLQRYEGHVNSHSRLQIGVDPTETFFMAGGEDCYMWIWSIKTGECLFASRISSHPVVTMCWPHTEDASSAGYETAASNEGSFLEDYLAERCSWSAWLGSFDGLFHVHGS